MENEERRRYLLSGMNWNVADEILKKRYNKEDLFEDFSTGFVFNDVYKPNFENTGRVHDWRNYVPDCWQKNWGRFTLDERRIIIIMAEIQAKNEEWD